MYRIGQGYDVHRMEEGETLWLGGIVIPHNKGTDAYSDGDVLLHAVCDALLGAVNLGDIGTHFPDTSPEFKDVDSKTLLKETYSLVKNSGFEIVNIDSTISAQLPKLNPHIPEMKTVIAGILKVDTEKISIKATTTEKLGFEGREEGIFALAVVLLKKIR